MGTIHLLNKRSFLINAFVSVQIPTVGQVLEDEDTYDSIVSLLTAMPIDLMVQLDDLGIDFEKINEYELFLLVFNSIKEMDASLIFGDLDLKKFEMVFNPDVNAFVLLNKESGAVIDMAAQAMIATVLRKILGIQKNTKMPANKAARDYLMERERKRIARRRRRQSESSLEQYIVALVNRPEFKYDFETVKDITIYQFYESLRQIIHNSEVDHKISGIYAGTIDAKHISSSELNWLTRKQ